MQHSHQPADIAQRLADQPKHSYLRDWVYGGIDGAVTTFAVVSGVVGAVLSHRIIIILGIANLMADGFSMAAANFLGTRAEEEEYHFYEDFESRQIERIPEGEREEIRQIFFQKGFKDGPLELIVNTITADKRLWVSTMLHEEYGLGKSVRSAWKAAFATFIAFVICGLVPLGPYLIGWRANFFWTCLGTSLVFFIIGSLKSRWSIHSWWRSGLTTLFIGIMAAALSYGIGFLFR